jgi:hypothetical protein
VRKQDERSRVFWNRQAPRENCAPGGNLYFSHN